MKGFSKDYNIRYKDLRNNQILFSFESYVKYTLGDILDKHEVIRKNDLQVILFNTYKTEDEFKGKRYVYEVLLTENKNKNDK